MSDPVRVGELLATLPGVAERLAEARLVAAWPAIAGPAAARSRAEGVEAGILHVTVDSSGWLHRLRLDEPSLLARCRAEAPAVSVRAIRFRLGPPPDARADSEGEVPR
jgi:predicted nucleic acid-binding Zn ribbon protein